MTDLKPCPNQACGAEAERHLLIVRPVSGDFLRNATHCLVCRLVGPVQPTKEKARDAWNALPRALPPGWRPMGEPLDLSQFEGHSPAEWRLQNDGGVEVPTSYHGPGYYDNPEIVDQNGQSIVGCGEYYVFNGNEADIRLLLRAPQLLAEVKRLREENARLRDMASEAADDLAAIADREYPIEDRERYPTLRRNYDGDMEIVCRIRAELAGRNATDG